MLVLYTNSVLLPKIPRRLSKIWFRDSLLLLESKSKNMNKILIDLGSSTVKVYKQNREILNLLVQRSIPFKDGFDPEGGITASNKKELFELIDSVLMENKGALVKIFATGIFRKLTNEARISLIDEFFQRTGLFFNVINQDLENFYLEMAMVGKSVLEEPVLLMNVGGGSTELVVIYGKEAVERKNIDLGVGTINNHFPQINDSLSSVELEKVVDHVNKFLPVLSNKVKTAFYTGGELSYMQLADYTLERNSLFEDSDHPSLISFESFAKRNKEIFQKITINELEKLMPNNPKWMYGARGCSAMAQAICEKYGVQTIIPSNSNIINGAIR